MKLYTFTLYQLSGIQKGIQSAHAAIEYGIGHVIGDEATAKKLFKEWSKDHKTMIILNGGTTTTMDEYEEELVRRGIPYSVFHEPDLGDVKTAISFILDPTSIHYVWVRGFSLASN